MQNTRVPSQSMIALMGPTGTGKSTFIHLLTNDENIRVGHDLDSQTFDVNTSIPIIESGCSLTLVDTPGFDDSREGVTDTDILGKIAAFLQHRGGRKLNGIIYLHRISDPRMGGMAKKNLRMFRELCGEDNFKNVRIVTTNWKHADDSEGNRRETALARGAFKPLIDGGAEMIRHDKGLESARLIISGLIKKTPVTLKIQAELSAGSTLGDTSAGAVIIEEMKELQKKHEKEMEELKKELEEAVNTNDEELRAELAEERRKLEELMARAGQDRKILQMAREIKSKSDAENIHKAVDEHMQVECQAAPVYTQPQTTRKRTGVRRGETTRKESGKREDVGKVATENATLLDEQNWSFSSVWQFLYYIVSLRWL